MMKEYGVMESWTKLFSCSVERVCRPLACSKNGDEVLDHKSGESLYWYQEEGWGLDSSIFMVHHTFFIVQLFMWIVLCYPIFD